MGKNIQVVVWGLSLSLLTACSNEYKFTRAPVQAFNQDLSCAKLTCTAVESGCRWVDPVIDVNGCNTTCGRVACDSPSAPTLNSLEQIVDNNALKWSAVKAPGTIKYRLIKKVSGVTTLEKTEFAKLEDSHVVSAFGKEHTYTVVAFSEHGESPESNALSIVPIERFSLEKISAGNAQVSFKWKKALGADKFVVRGAKSGSALQEIAATLTTSGTVVTAQVSGLENGVAYDFDVVASNTKVKRPSDNRLSLIPFDGFQMIGRSAASQAASVSWSELKGASGYRLIYWEAANKAGTQVEKEAALGKALPVTGLKNGTLYTFQACALINGDCIPTTNTINARPLDVPVISGITGKVSQVDVAWGAVAGGKYFQVSSPAAKSAVVEIAPGQATIAAAPAGTVIPFTVIATNDDGGRTESKPVNGVSFSNFTITQAVAGDGVIDLEWTKAEGATDYEVIVAQNGVTNAPVTVGPNLNAQLKTGFVNGSNVRIFVRAKRTGQSGSIDSNTVEVLPLGAFIISKVTEGVRKVKLDWTELKGAASYQVYSKKATDAAYGAPVSVGNGLTYEVTNLDVEVTYDFYVKAVTAINTTKDSPVVKGTPYGDFKITKADDEAEVKAVSLEWSAYAPGFSYQVVAKKGVDAEVNVGTAVANTQNRIDSLNIEETYAVTVVAKKGARTMRSDTVTVVPKGAFKILSADPGFGTVTLKWEAYPKPKFYVIEYTYVNGATRETKFLQVDANDADTVSKIVDGLHEVAQYEFIVKAQSIAKPTRLVPSAKVSVITKRDTIRQFRPALAVRGTGCIGCHLVLGPDSNLISDFGMNLDAGAKDAFFTKDWKDRDYPGDDAQASAKAGGYYGESKNGLSFAGDTHIAGALVNAPYANQKLITLSHVLASHKPKVQPFFKGDADAKFYDGKSKITIGAPLPSDIRKIASGRMPIYSSSDGSIQVYQEKDDISDAEFSGAIAKNGNKYLEISGEFSCMGDIVITGAPVFLKNAVAKTGKKGCRIYSEKVVFTLSTIKGGRDVSVKSVDGSALTSENIQISSGQAISVGYGSNSLRTDLFNDFADEATKAAFPERNYSSMLRTNGCSLWSAVMKTPGMTIGASDGDPLMRAETSEGGSKRSKAFFQDVLYSQSLTIPDLSPANYPKEQFCTLLDSGRNPELDKSSERVLLNAPWVLRKYNGIFKGAVIAELAHMTIGGFHFTYDSVFDDKTVPLLPLLPSNVKILEIAD